LGKLESRGEPDQRIEPQLAQAPRAQSSAPQHSSYSRRLFAIILSGDMNNIRQVQALNKRELENAVYVHDLLDFRNRH
jgi:hypothetical protein